MAQNIDVFAGTFAVIQLIVGNSVESILVGNEELRNCTVSIGDRDSDMEVFFQGELTNCVGVKTDTVLTLSFLAGIIMVSYWRSAEISVSFWAHC